MKSKEETNNGSRYGSRRNSDNCSVSSAVTNKTKNSDQGDRLNFKPVNKNLNANFNPHRPSKKGVTDKITGGGKNNIVKKVPKDNLWLSRNKR